MAPWPETCPTWCNANHRQEDLVDDQFHFSKWLKSIPLPNAKYVVTNGNEYPRQLMVYVEQHISEETPRVILIDEHSAEAELRLSDEEALQLGAALLHGRTIITDRAAARN